MEELDPEPALAVLELALALAWPVELDAGFDEAVELGVGGLGLDPPSAVITARAALLSSW